MGETLTFAERVRRGRILLTGGHQPGYTQNRNHGKFAPGEGERESSGGGGRGGGGGGGGRKAKGDGDTEQAARAAARKAARAAAKAKAEGAQEAEALHVASRGERALERAWTGQAGTRYLPGDVELGHPGLRSYEYHGPNGERIAVLEHQNEMGEALGAGIGGGRYHLRQTDAAGRVVYDEQHLTPEGVRAYLQHAGVPEHLEAPAVAIRRADWQMTPIAGINPDILRGSVYGAHNPHGIAQMYGHDQLEKYWRDVTIDELRRTASVLQEQFPGTGPRSAARSADLRDYIIAHSQRGTGPAEEFFRLDNMRNPHDPEAYRVRPVRDAEPRQIRAAAGARADGGRVGGRGHAYHQARIAKAETALARARADYDAERAKYGDSMKASDWAATARRLYLRDTERMRAHG